MMGGWRRVVVSKMEGEKFKKNKVTEDWRASSHVDWAKGIGE